MRLTDLPDALRDQGVEPVVVDGFYTRGDPFASAPVLHLLHWTAGPSTGRTPSLATVTYGRPDLPYNLCQVLQSREGGTRPDKAYCVSSGMAAHGGTGTFAGINSANRRGTGNEIEWSGPAEVFPGNRYETSIRIAAAFQSLHANPSGAWCCNHRDYATPAGRKQDTNIPLAKIQADVNAQLLGDAMALLNREEIDQMKTIIRQVLNEGTGSGQTSWAKTVQRTLSIVQSHSNDLDALKAGVSKVLTELPAAVVAALPPSSGGTGSTGPTLAQIQTALEAVIEANLGFLKPGQ